MPKEEYVDVEELHKKINGLYDEYEEKEKEILIENAAPAFISGDLKAQKALDLKLSFNLVNKEALKYLKEYKADLERGGSVIQGEFIPWLSDKSKEDRAAIAKIIEDGYKAGKPTGVKQYQKAGKYGLYPKNSIAGDLQGFFTARRSHAATVARTEIARIQAHGSMTRYKKQSVKKVMWLVFHPCPLCEPYSRKVFDIDKVPYEVPRHPNCRCALAPVPDDVPTGPAPNQKIPKVFEREAKALPARPAQEWQAIKQNYGQGLVPSDAPDSHSAGWIRWQERKDEYTRPQEQAAEYYVGSGYVDFNKWLRKPSTRDFNYYSTELYGEDDDEKVAALRKLLTGHKKELDAAVQKSTIPADVTLYRSPGRHFTKDILENGVAIEPGYSSTATTFEAANRFGRRGDDGIKNIMVFEGKKDQPGFYVSTQEHEVLKPRDTKYKLLGVSEVDSVQMGEYGDTYGRVRLLFVKIIN